jgi:hypothetical protein
LQIDNIVSMAPGKLSRREAMRRFIPVVQEGGACGTTLI